jgi:hypothetical protein
MFLAPVSCEAAAQYSPPSARTRAEASSRKVQNLPCLAFKPNALVYMSNFPSVGSGTRGHIPQCFNRPLLILQMGRLDR